MDSRPPSGSQSKKAVNALGKFPSLGRPWFSYRPILLVAAARKRGQVSSDSMSVDRVDRPLCCEGGGRLLDALALSRAERRRGGGGEERFLLDGDMERFVDVEDRR